MPLSKPPIRRLELEFLPSNISGYDSIIKINVVKEPGFVGDVFFIDIDKFIVDESNIDVIKASEKIMNYIGEGVYMSDDVFMGGLEIVDLAKDKANVKIFSINLKDFNYLLDFSVDPSNLLLFSLSYIYDSVEYKTPVVISYRPVETKPLYKGFIRPCITKINNRFRGPNESLKYDQFNEESYSDLKYMNEIRDELAVNIIDNTTLMDEMTTTLYNIVDRTSYYKKYILGI